MRRKTKNRLKALDGTEKVFKVGEWDEEIQIAFKPHELTTRGLTVQQVSAQIRDSDSKLSSGQLRTQQGEMLLEVSGELDTLTRLENLPIYFGSEREIIRLGNLATITKGVADAARQSASVR